MIETHGDFTTVARRTFRRRQVLRAAGACAAGLAAGCSLPASVARTSARAPAAPPESPARAQPHGLSLPPEVRHGPRDRPGVALTFHGQGPRGLVQDLLTVLEKAGAPGTILAVGTWLRSEPDFARRILDGGHELGNHTMHHLAIASMSRPNASREVRDCAAVLRRLTGTIGTWFRPSQTQYATPVVLAALRAAGYPTSLSYDVDSLDYTDPGVEAITGNVLRQARGGSIVSLHAGHPQTVSAMPAVIDGLRNRGLRPMTMTGLMSQ